jgi:hypothetical protein
LACEKSVGSSTLVQVINAARRCHAWCRVLPWWPGLLMPWTKKTEKTDEIFDSLAYNAA